MCAFFCVCVCCSTSVCSHLGALHQRFLPLHGFHSFSRWNIPKTQTSTLRRVRKKKKKSRWRRSRKGRLARGVGQNSCPMIMFMKIITRRGSCWVRSLQRQEGFKVETLLLPLEKEKKCLVCLRNVVFFNNRMHRTDVEKANSGLLIARRGGKRRFFFFLASDPPFHQIGNSVCHVLCTLPKKGTNFSQQVAAAWAGCAR